jgi:TM2 domain-containing membrane protein YozV
MKRRAFVAMALAFLIPGAGHFYLGRRARALAFFTIVTLMFVTGLAVDGSLYTLGESRGQLLARVATLASMGSGALYFLGNLFGPPGDIGRATYEYGRTFTLTAGLMNLLLVLDCWDLASVSDRERGERSDEALP